MPNSTLSNKISPGDAREARNDGNENQNPNKANGEANKKRESEMKE